jgi:hypothetical protein
MLLLLFVPMALSAQQAPTFLDEFCKIPDSCENQDVYQYNTYSGFLRFNWVGSPAEKMHLRIKYSRKQDRYYILQKGSDSLRYYAKISFGRGSYIVHVIYCLGSCLADGCQMAYFTLRTAAQAIKREAKRCSGNGEVPIHHFTCDYWEQYRKYW